MSACGGQGGSEPSEDTSEVSDSVTDTADTSTTEPDSEDTSTLDTAALDTSVDTADSTSPDGDALDIQDSRPDEETSLPDVPDTAEPDWTTSENYPRTPPTGPSCATYEDCRALGLNICDARYKVCVECQHKHTPWCRQDQECKDYQCVDVGTYHCEYDYQCDSLPDTKACSPKTRTCTECVKDWQCPAGHRCLDEQCVAFTSCTNSLDCPTDRVCARNQPVRVNWCVECGRDEDCSAELMCGPDMTCIDDLVEPPEEPAPDNEEPILRFKPCDSDLDCRDLGLLCNFQKGHCGECTPDLPCELGYGCQDGFCVMSECQPGDHRCAPACTVIGNCDAGIKTAQAPVTGYQRCGYDGRWQNEYLLCDPLADFGRSYCLPDRGYVSNPCTTRSSLRNRLCQSDLEPRCFDAHVGLCRGPWQVDGWMFEAAPCGHGEGQPDQSFIREY